MTQQNYNKIVIVSEAIEQSLNRLSYQGLFKI